MVFLFSKLHCMPLSLCMICVPSPALPCHSIPREVCTVISDPTCQFAQDVVCNSVDANDACVLTVRRAFRRAGRYCVNFTLGDDASLAFTSTLVSITSKGEFYFMTLRVLYFAGKACAQY